MGVKHEELLGKDAWSSARQRPRVGFVAVRIVAGCALSLSAFAVGSHAAPAYAQPGNCDSNYAGACVPIASDVDCANGSGNGPAYVAGPVRVVGTDIYDLDRDGDGIGCQS